MDFLNRWVLAVAALVALGCSHEWVLAPPNVAAARLPSLSGKRIALVIGEPQLHDTYETSTDGHSFTFTGVHAFYSKAFQDALGASGASVSVVNAPPTPGQFHGAVVPTLALEASGMISHSCTAKFSVSVTDANGTPLKTETGSSEQTFGAVAAAEQACKAAMTSSFNEAAYPALEALAR